VFSSSDESESSESSFEITAVFPEDGALADFAEGLTVVVFGTWSPSSLESDDDGDLARTFTWRAFGFSSSDDPSSLSSGAGSLGTFDYENLIRNRYKNSFMLSHTFPFATSFLFAADFACSLAAALGF
jgi:hypothetical protein